LPLLFLQQRFGGRSGGIHEFGHDVRGAFWACNPLFCRPSRAVDAGGAIIPVRHTVSPLGRATRCCFDNGCFRPLVPAAQPKFPKIVVERLPQFA
jgi:hypothetical protein